MRLIDADALERMGYVLTRTYQLDQKTMVYETKKLSDVPSVEPDFDSAYQEGFTIAEAKYRAIIDDMKAAPPPHWLNPLGDFTPFTCDCCGHMSDIKTPYCAHCGSKMEGCKHDTTQD